MMEKINYRECQRLKTRDSMKSHSTKKVLRHDIKRRSKLPVEPFWLRFLLLILTVFILCFSNPAIAADVKLVPRITVRGGYDDNITFSETEQLKSSVITVKPGLMLSYKTPASKLLMSADYDILSYLEESELNRVNQYYQLRGDRWIKQRWNVSGDFQFIKDTTLNSYLEETGRLVDRVGREYISAMGEAYYSLTQLSSIGGSYQYSKARYAGDVYPDYDRHRIDFRYRRKLKNQRDTLSIGPSFYHRNNDLNNVDYVSLDVGWARDWSRIFNTKALLGARYTNVEESDGTTNDTWGARARFDLKRTGEVSTIKFLYYHDLNTNTDGTDINVDNFYLGYNYLFTERFGAGLIGRLVFSYDLFSDQNSVEDSRLYELEPSLFYKLTQKLNLSFRYNYQNSSSDLVSRSNSRERNRVWIQLDYSFPLML